MSDPENLDLPTSPRLHAYTSMWRLRGDAWASLADLTKRLSDPLTTAKASFRCGSSSPRSGPSYALTIRSGKGFRRQVAPAALLRGGHSTLFGWLATAAPDAQLEQGCAQTLDNSRVRGLRPDTILEGPTSRFWSLVSHVNVGIQCFPWQIRREKRRDPVGTARPEAVNGQGKARR